MQEQTNHSSGSPSHDFGRSIVTARMVRWRRFSVASGRPTARSWRLGSGTAGRITPPIFWGQPLIKWRIWQGRRARIPKGFRPKAQGCEERATLGSLRPNAPTPKELCPLSLPWKNYATICGGPPSQRIATKRSPLSREGRFCAGKNRNSMLERSSVITGVTCVR